MEYNDVKQYLTGCPELAPLDEAAAAALFWRGQEQTFGLGDVVYAEGEKLDHTFCLLLSGWSKKPVTSSAKFPSTRSLAKWLTLSVRPPAAPPFEWPRCKP